MRARNDVHADQFAFDRFNCLRSGVGRRFHGGHVPDDYGGYERVTHLCHGTDQFDVRGKYVTERTLRDGIGAPIVAVEREVNKHARADFAPSRVFYSVTAVARFEGPRCLLSFEDPLATETVTLDEHTFPLAADFTVPLAVMLKQTDPKKHELARLLNPEK